MWDLGRDSATEEREAGAVRALGEPRGCAHRDVVLEGGAATAVPSS